MENEINSSVVIAKSPKETNVIVPINKRISNWQKIKMEFFVSKENSARKFLVEKKYFTDKEIVNSDFVRLQIKGWNFDKQEWQKNNVEISLQNLKDTQVGEMTAFIEDERTIVKQLLNISKIGMNSVLEKVKDPKTGKEIITLKSTKGFREVAETTLNILKYSRRRLGFSMDGDVDTDKIKDVFNNFNLNLINFEEFDIDKVTKILNKPYEERRTAPFNKPSEERVHEAKRIEEVVQK